jgi:hypothetical protein
VGQGLNSLEDVLSRVLGKIPGSQPAAAPAPQSSVPRMSRVAANCKCLDDLISSRRSENALLLKSSQGEMSFYEWFDLCVREEPPEPKDMNFLRTLEGAFQHFQIGAFNEWRTALVLNELMQDARHNIFGFIELPRIPVLCSQICAELSSHDTQQAVARHQATYAPSLDQMKVDIAVSLNSEHTLMYPIQVKSKSHNPDSTILLSNEDIAVLKRKYKPLGRSCKPLSTLPNQVALMVCSNIPVINHQRCGKTKTQIKAELLEGMRARSLILAKPIDETSHLEILIELFKQGFLAERHYRD